MRVLHSRLSQAVHSRNTSQNISQDIFCARSSALRTHRTALGQRSRLGQSHMLLRGVSVVLLLSCLWSFGIAPVAMAAVPAPSAVKRRTTPMTQAELTRRLMEANRSAFKHLAQTVKGKKKSALPTLAEMVRRDGLRRQNLARHPVPAPVYSALVTLLDDVGRLARAVSPAEVLAWKTELKRPSSDARRTATLHLWVGEYLLAHDQDPHGASWHWRAAQQLTQPADSLYGLADYDHAIATFNEGAYQEAADNFLRLSDQKTARDGYDRRKCALWLRHAAACAGYHLDRSRMGIPEPPRLDPLCGVAALATCLKALSLPYDRALLLKNCRVTGEGNNLGDIIAAGPKLGVTVRPLTATDEGLRELPKPLVAYIEHDHFVAVTNADKKGVTYLCSDCGVWPGGAVRLSWKQWDALNPGVYASVNKPGGYWDQVLAAKEAKHGGVQVASALPASGLLASPVRKVASYLPHMPALKGVKVGWFSVTFPECASKFYTLRCNECWTCCWMDFLNCLLGGPCEGDPVNLSTGEEEYRPPADLTVYNPAGPSVTWKRIYNSLGSQQRGLGDQDYGNGWSDNYNVGVSGQSIIFDNGSNLPFKVLATPTAGHPSACSVPPGTPLIVEADYSANGTYYTITFQDRTRWITNPSNGRLAQIVDRNGNAINFKYSATSGLLASITDKLGVSLLTITRSSNNTVAAISDRYGRSVYYNVGGYYAYDYDSNDLNYVSQVVSSCSANPPARYVYGYYDLGYGKADPILQTITVPSPTGTGTSTSTITYGGNGYVTSVADGAGNKHVYTSMDITGAQNPTGNYTQVQEINGKTGAVDASYTVGYDSSMNQTARMDGAGRLTSYKVYSDPNDPYRPSSVIDGNANQTYPDQHTTSGTTAVFNITGTQVPAAGTWDIVSPTGAILATDVSPGAWKVSFNYQTRSNMSVTVPSAVPPGNGYMVRYQMPSATIKASAPFDIVNTTAGYGTTTFTWDAFHNVISTTSPRGTTTTNTYVYSQFALGELTGTQEGSKTSTLYSYDDTDGYTDASGLFVPCGLVSSVASPKPGSASGSGARVTTSYSYDVSGQGSKAMGSLGLGNILSVTAPGNNATIVNGVDQRITTTFAYTGDGTAVTTPSLGLPLSVTDNLNEVTHMRYDAQGQRVAMIDALGNETDSSYNENGGTVSLGNQLQTMTLPATGQTGTGHSGSASTYLYPGGPLVSATSFDESSHAVRQVNTTRDQESEILAVSGSTEPVSYTYDALYRLRTLTDGGGHTTTYFYNAAGYLAQVVYPGAQTTPPTSPLPAGSADTVSFTGYDPNGNPLTRVDGRNQTTTYSYNDPESMPTDIMYPSGTIGAVHFNYDQYGRRGNIATGAPGMTDGTGGQAYAYDDADNLTAKQVTWTGLPPKTVSYSFYSDGSQASMNADGQTFSYGYDAVGRMTGLTNPFSETSAWTYKYNSWLATCTRSNSGGGVVANTAYTYNSLGQMSELLNKSGTGTTLSDYKGMVYDAVGNHTSLTASVPGAPASYSGTTSYGYDYGQTANPVLNRDQVTSETSTRGTGTLSYGYDGGTTTGPGNPTSFKGATNSFNADNQQTGTGYGYDGAGNPTTYKSATLAFDPENRVIACGTAQTDSYNGDGLRAWKQSGGNTTYFLCDGTQPVSEYNGSGTLLATNTVGAGGLVSRHTGASSTFYAFDERGNVSQQLSSTGAVAGSDLYDAYGGRTGTAAQADPFGFGAQAVYYADGETGFVLCTHRFYDPTNGRWLTRDPIGYTGGVNLYGYVGNDPGNKWDPLGYMDPGAITMGTGGFGLAGGLGLAGLGDLGAGAIAAGAVAVPVLLGTAAAGAGWLIGTPIGNAIANGIPGQDGLPASPNQYRKAPYPGKPDYGKLGHYPTGPHYDPDPTKHKGGPHWDYPDPNNPGRNISYPAPGHPLCPSDPNDAGPELK